MNTEVNKALQRLQAAVDNLEQAIVEFGKVHESQSVGLDEWIESNEETMLELRSELEQDE